MLAPVVMKLCKVLFVDNLITRILPNKDEPIIVFSNESVSLPQIEATGRCEHLRFNVNILARLYVIVHP